MTSDSAPKVEEVRAAEIVASLCLATDLGLGAPFEYGFQSTLMAMRLADLMGVDRETKEHTYYASLLHHLGCTTERQDESKVWPNPLEEAPLHIYGSLTKLGGLLLRQLSPSEAGGIRRIYETVTRLPRAFTYVVEQQRSMCEVAESLSDRLGMPAEVTQMFYFSSDRWDGHGPLRRAQKDEIPLPLRITAVAKDIAIQKMVGGGEHTLETIRSRSGHAFDPDVVAAFTSNASDVIGTVETTDPLWDLVLDAEPKPHLVLDEAGVDRALSAIADFTDLLAPSLVGHSSGVAYLAASAARIAGFGDDEVRSVHRASLIHDLGRVAVSAAIWEKQDPLTTDELEQVRLHPYHTERAFARSPFLADLSELASCHHEHLDGSGYHRGLTAKSMGHQSRLVAAADTLHALTEPRAYRKPFDAEEAAEIMVERANSGLLDPMMVRAVVEALGEPPPAVEYPAGLTEREIEVLGLIARGLQTKQMARRFNISPKTADAHIQSAYRKIGVSTRAAATVFAMEHGLVRI